MRQRIIVPFIVLLVGLSVSGCQQAIPWEALQLTEVSLQNRQKQTRRFETSDEDSILSACSALLQDLGFNLDESEPALGVIVASKDRHASEAVQVIGSFMFAILFGVDLPIDSKQKLRASVITSPHGESQSSITVRVTFQRIVWNTNGQISKQEPMNEPKQYQEFFEKLSKAVFLEAQEI